MVLRMCTLMNIYIYIYIFPCRTHVPRPVQVIHVCVRAFGCVHLALLLRGWKTLARHKHTCVHVFRCVLVSLRVSVCLSKALRVGRVGAYEVHPIQPMFSPLTNTNTTTTTTHRRRLGPGFGGGAQISSH